MKYLLHLETHPGTPKLKIVNNDSMWVHMHLTRLICFPIHRYHSQWDCCLLFTLIFIYFKYRFIFLQVLKTLDKSIDDSNTDRRVKILAWG